MRDLCQSPAVVEDFDYSARTSGEYRMHVAGIDDANTGHALTASMGDLINKGFAVRASQISSVNTAASLINSYVGSVCFVCARVTLPAAIFTSVVDGTFSGSYLTGVPGLVIGKYSGQAGAAVDFAITFSRMEEQ